ncbi:glycosyltransferase family 2 protein [Phyllobacterium salinisoli]|nr:glycosyltransferase [Phyllobacterium salinisoli]
MDQVVSRLADPQWKVAGSRKICIGTVTRRRPNMLRCLLSSYVGLQLSSNLDVTFVVVENDSEKSLHCQIDEFRKAIKNQVVYLLEPHIGIASARNSVLNYAVENGFDFLFFADDDEFVTKDWLNALLHEHDAGNLDIIGSPVRLAPPSEPLTMLQKTVFHGLQQINCNAERRCVRKRNSGASNTIKIATGSWLGNLDFFRRTGLRFDANLGLAGGEDWQLWNEARRLGAKTGWTPFAVVYETIPLGRLSFNYYYRRNRDYARSSFISRRRDTAAIAGFLLSRIYKILFSFISLPIRRQRALLMVIANLGSLIGYLQGAAGMASSHYENVDGN